MIACPGRASARTRPWPRPTPCLPGRPCRTPSPTRRRSGSPGVSRCGPRGIRGAGSAYPARTRQDSAHQAETRLNANDSEVYVNTRWWGFEVVLDAAAAQTTADISELVRDFAGIILLSGRASTSASGYRLSRLHPALAATEASGRRDKIVYCQSAPRGALLYSSRSGMAKAGLPEPHSPEGASRTTAGKTPETGAVPCGRLYWCLPQSSGARNDAQRGHSRRRTGRLSHARCVWQR